MNINSIFTSPALTRLANNKGVQKTLSDLSNESKLLPILLLETSVLAGRSYHAQKRGGFYEFKETVIENVLAAIIWMGGVKALNKVADLFCQNVLNLNTKMDWKQVFNEANGRLNSKQFLTKMLTAKSLKLLFSVATSIYAVGVLLPKYKQRLTLKSIEKQKKEAAAKKLHQAPAVNLNQNNTGLSNKPVSGDAYKVVIPSNITAADLLKLAAQSPVASGVRFEGSPDKKKSKAISFAGSPDKPSGKDVSFGGVFDVVARVGYALENEAVPQLAVVDTGITGGRVVNARNKDEAIEILFRDAASCATYFFAVPFISKRLASAFDPKLGINTILDPKALDPLTAEFKNRIINIAKANKGLVGVDDIQRALLGTNNQTVANAIKNALLQSKDKALTPEQIKKIVDGFDGVLTKTVTEAAGMSKSQFAREMSHYLKGIGLRATDVAKAHADKITSGNIRSLANLLDDIVRQPGATSAEVKSAAKAMKQLSNAVYGQVQSGSAIKPETIKQVESIVSKLKGTNIDDTIMRKVADSLKAVSVSSKSAGFVTKEALEEVIKGGLVKDSRFISKVLSGINGAVKNPLAHVSKGETVHLQKSAKLYAERIIAELQKTGAIKAGEKVDLKAVQGAIDKTLTASKNKNMLFKGLYLLGAIIVSALLLGWIIPKVQYAITKMRTGKDSFPGVAGLIDEEGKTNKGKAKPAHSTANNSAPAPVVANAQPLQTGSEAFNYFLQQRLRNS